MNKTFIAIMLSLTMILLSGCSYVAYKDYYSSIDDYYEIWELPGFRHDYSGVSPIFPENIENFDVQDFYCRYDQQLPLGEGVQVFLKIQFDDSNVFEDELKRIKQLSLECSEYFDRSDFESYAICLGENYSSEYALVGKDDLLIYYISLYNIPKEQIEFDHQFLPINYEGYGEIKTDISSQ